MNVYSFLKHFTCKHFLQIKFFLFLAITVFLFGELNIGLYGLVNLKSKLNV